MRRARGRRGAAAPALGPVDEARVEALTVAMALAPGVYARNRMYDLFASAGMKRARTRAAMLRGIVKHLGRASGLRLEREGAVRDARHDPRGGLEFVLRYELPALRLSRVVELSRGELATLRVMAGRAGALSLPADEEDRALVDAALARLLVAGGVAGGLALEAQRIATSPVE